MHGGDDGLAASSGFRRTNQWFNARSPSMIMRPVGRVNSLLASESMAQSRTLVSVDGRQHETYETNGGCT
jgi:hypothetical protein